MLQFPKPQRSASLLLVPLAVLVFGLLATYYLVQRQHEQNESFSNRRFTTVVHRFSADVERRMRDYQFGLRGSRGAIVSAGEAGLSRKVFERYSATRDIEQEFPGARGFGFIRRVAAGDAKGFVETARRDGWPAFAIKEISPNEGERFVIQYIEPVARNVQAIGLDIASEENRRTAALEAIRLNGPTITEPITLVQATGAINRAFLVLLPIYRSGQPVGTPEQRMAAAWGWSYAPIVLDEVLADLMAAEPDIRWSVDDLRPDGSQSGILSNLPATSNGDRTLSQDVPIFNRTWRIKAQAMPSFDASLKQLSPFMIAMEGAIVTFLAFMAALLWSRTRQREHDDLSAKAQLATIIENSEQAVIGEDNDGKVILWNKAAEDLFQHRAREVLGERLQDVLELTGTRLQTSTTAGPDQPSRTAQEITVSAPLQAPRVLMVSRGPILSASGRPLGQATLLQDITERRAMEDALASSNRMLEQRVLERTGALANAEAFLQTVLDSVPSVISYWDLRGINRAANAAFLQWRGLPRESVNGELMEKLLPPQDIEGLKPDMDRAWAGEFRKSAFRARDPLTKEWRTFSGTLVPDMPAGVIKGLYFVADDVTELVRSQSALEISLNDQHAERVRLASIIEGTHAGTWEWNVQTGETRFNERWADIVGLRLADLAPVSIRTWAELAHPDDLGASQGLLEKHFRGETPYYECEARMRHRDGHWVWVLDRGRVMTRTADGQPEWMFGTHQDITQRRSMEDDLRAAKQAAEAANSAKSQFLANVSHEIRTPLNAVLGMHRLLENTELSGKQRDLLSKADQAGHSLLDILNDVLDLAKIEAGEMSLQSDVFELKALLEELATIYAPSASGKGITFSAHLRGMDACWMVGDRLRLRQVLANLVGNAIKFTQAGGVLLLADVDRSGDEARLNLKVRDSGIGIAPDALKRLFNPFMQADDTTTRRFGGTGLGLSIVRNLVEMMAGEVSVTSTPGRGSEFNVVLPLIEAHANAVRDAQAAKRSIEVGFLCADHAMCEELKERLLLLGWNGVDLSTAMDHQPDIVLIDAALGPAAAVRLRELEDGAGTAPSRLNVLVVGTAQELASLKGTGLADEPSTTKPVSISAVFNAIVEQLSRTDALQARLLSPSNAMSGSLRWLNGARVAVVDDSEINREIALELLRGQGAVCVDFPSGQAVLQWLDSHMNDVDAILMDVQMPVIDGLQATRMIREHPQGKNVPVIALTAGALQSERDNAMAAGMNAFLTKPLEPAEVVRTLRRVIGQHRGNLIEVTVPVRPLQNVNAQTDGSWPLIDGIDLDMAKPRLSNSPVLFAKLLRLMLKNYATWSNEWSTRLQALDSDSNAELGASLHKLRGSASMIGAVKLADSAGGAEDALSGSGPDVVRSRIDAVATDLGLLLCSIAAWDGSTQVRRPDVATENTLSQEQVDRLQELLRLLHANDLDAVEQAPALRTELSFAIDAAGMEQWLDLVDSLRFDEAAAQLSLAVERYRSAVA
jgi:PAS domain S-box-containing protein